MGALEQANQAKDSEIEAKTCEIGAKNAELEAQQAGAAEKMAELQGAIESARAQWEESREAWRSKVQSQAGQVAGLQSQLRSGVGALTDKCSAIEAALEVTATELAAQVRSASVGFVGFRYQLATSGVRELHV